MNRPYSDSTALRSRATSTINRAVASALSLYPEFDRLPDHSVDTIRNDLILLIGRLQHVNRLSLSFRKIEFSLQMKALIKHVGLA